MLPTHSRLLSFLFLWPVAFQLGAASSNEKIDYFRHDAGLARETSHRLPDSFDSAADVVWRVPLDSGHSTPVSSHGKLFLTTYHPPDRKLATIALDQKDGHELWSRPLATTEIEQVHPEMGNPATPTPACDGERVYSFFGSYGLLCHDLAGKLLWEQRMGPFRDEYGAGSSPMLIDGKVVLSQDHDIDSFLMALEARTGKTLWKVSRPNAVRSYSTPVPWQQDGQRQLLVAGALELAAYEPATGEKLWWVEGLARIVIPLPITTTDTIYMASWAPGGDTASRVVLDRWPVALKKWDKNKDEVLTESEVNDREVLTRFFRMDLDQNKKLDQKEWEQHAAIFGRAQNAILALRPHGRGDVTASALLWKYQRGIPYVATPVLHQGILYMVKDGGIVTKLDAATGQVLQEERLPALGNYYASPVAGDGKVYFASERGALTVLAATREWKVLSTHDLKEKIYATPVLEAGRVFVRTEKALYCFQGSDNAKAP